MMFVALMPNPRATVSTDLLSAAAASAGSAKMRQEGFAGVGAVGGLQELAERCGGRRRCVHGVASCARWFAQAKGPPWFDQAVRTGLGEDLRTTQCLSGAATGARSVSAVSR